MGWSQIGDPGRVLQKEMLKSLAQRAKVGKIKSQGSWGISQTHNQRMKAAAEKRRKAAGIID
jgi:hypothetical protein